MKKLFYLPVIAIMCFMAFSLLPSCKKHPAMRKVGIDVQFSFQGDRVQLFLDGKQLLDQVLTTDDLVSVCFIDPRIVETVKEGRHTLKVTVNDISFTEEFLLTKDLYIGVQYKRPQKTIEFKYSDEPFYYL